MDQAAAWVELRDDAGEEARQAEERRLVAALRKAERLMDRGYIRDDNHVGLVYRRGESSVMRVPVIVYCFMQAITLGAGRGLLLDRAKGFSRIRAGDAT